MLIGRYVLALAALLSFSAAVQVFAQSDPQSETNLPEPNDWAAIAGVIVAIASAAAAFLAIRNSRKTDTKNLQLHILDRIFEKYSNDDFKKARHAIIAEYRKHLNENQKELKPDDYFEKYLRINLLEKDRSLKEDLELATREMAQIAIMINPEQKENSEIEKFYFDAFWNSILRVWPAMDEYLKFLGPVTGNMDYGKFFRSQVNRAHTHWKKHNQNSAIKYYDFDKILSDLAKTKTTT